MSVVVGHGVVPIKPDFGADFHRNIQREGAKATDGLTKQFGGAFKKIAALSGGIFVGAQVIGQLKSAFSEAAEAQKVGRLTEQVIKTTGGAAKITAKQVGDLSAAISNKTAIDDEAIQSGANLLLTFTKVRNEAGKGNAVFDRTVAVANDMSVALGQDMKSSSLQLGKALNDPIKGVTALSRAGVSFTQQQKDQIKAMQESGDLLGAQKLILAEVETQFGGAAAAVATPVERLKVVWGNLLEDLGTRAMPIIEKVATWLGDMLPKALDMAGQAFGRVSEFLAPAIATLKEFFYTLTSGFFEDEGTPVEEFALRVRDAIFGIIDVGKKIVPVLIDLWKNFTPLGLIVSHFEGVKTGIGVAKDAIMSFLDGLQGKGGEGSFFTDLGEAARGLARVFMEDVVPVIRTVVAWIGDHLKPILIGLGIVFALIAGPVLILVGAFIFAYQKFQVFRDVVSTVMAVVKELVTRYIDIVIIYFGLLLVPIKLAAKVVMEILWPAVQTAFRFITDVVMWAWENVLKPIFGFISAVITNVLIPTFNFLKSVVVDFVFPLIVAVIKDAWGIIKPVFDIIVGFVSGILAPVFNTLWTVVSTVFQGVQTAVTAAWDFVRPIFETVIAFIQDKLVPVWDAIKSAAGAAFNAIPGLIQGALRLVGGIVAGFLDGVGSIADAIGLKDIAKVLKSGANSARGWGQGSTSNNTGQGTGNISVQGGTRRAMGGPIPGSGRGDHVRILAEPGEFMQRRAAVDYYGLPFMKAINEMRFAKGGLIPDIGDIVDKARGLGTSALERVWPMMDVGGGAFTKGGIPAGGANYLREALFKLIRGKETEGKFSGSGSVGGAGAAAAAIWIRAAMGLTGTPESWFNTLMARAKLESGFNPRAINLWDSNAKAGHPSKGLFQTIDGTFNRYKLPGHGDIWNPVDNAAAAMQYIKAQYGSIFNINPRTGYAAGGLVHLKNFDGGGVLSPGWNAVRNDTGRDEHLSPRGAPLVENFYANSREDVAEFWQRAEFHAMAGHL